MRVQHRFPTHSPSQFGHNPNSNPSPRGTSPYHSSDTSFLSMPPMPNPPAESTYLERTTFPETGGGRHRSSSYVERYINPEIGAPTIGNTRKPLNAKGLGLNTKLGTTDLDEALGRKESPTETQSSPTAISEVLALDKKSNGPMLVTLHANKTMPQQPQEVNGSSDQDIAEKDK